MKAVVRHGIGDIRVDDVPEPRIEQPTRAADRHRLVLSAYQRGASRVIAIDGHADRLEQIHPEDVVTEHEPLTDAVGAYREFDLCAAPAG
ncbi:hypothetical protein ACLQ24_20440 [Micromonospora sp. DT4]|uniref:hypothetical protein n=1 Tax=Micromonospora sp. DT4 TaxID=3393438 RepID=UPI003CFBBAD7